MHRAGVDCHVEARNPRARALKAIEISSDSQVDPSDHAMRGGLEEVFGCHIGSTKQNKP